MGRAAVGPPLFAQTAGQVAAAAATITPADIVRHMSAVADSVRGRETIRHDRELVAEYVAEQFAASGLKATGADKGWKQRFPISPRFDIEQSRVRFAMGGLRAVGDFKTAAQVVTRSIPENPAPASVVLVAGRHTLLSLDQVSGRGKIVLYVPPVLPPGARPIAPHEVQARLAEGNQGVVFVNAHDSVAFAQQLHKGRNQPDVVTGGTTSKCGAVAPTSAWIVEVRPDAIKGITPLLMAANLDLRQLHHDTLPVIRELPELTVTFEPKLVPTRRDSVAAPNVMGKLEGRDPKLAREYVIVIASMGPRDGRSEMSDLWPNQAGGDATGLAGLIALAKAFSQPDIRPRRTLLFAAFSGGGQGVGGNFCLAKSFHALRSASVLSSPDMPLPVATLALNLTGGARGDTFAIAGLQEVTWPTPPSWLATAHPELRLMVVDGGTLFRPEAEHFPFVQGWLPSLSFHPSEQETTPAASGRLPRLESDQAARMLQYVFRLGMELANADGRPQWTPESRRRLLGGP